MDIVRSVFEFLNKESGAISAIATAMYSLATLALIFWTVRYVRLTRSLAASSSEQVRHMVDEQRAKRESSRQGLHELTKIILIMLNQLPKSPERVPELAHITLWTEADLIDMRNLARELDGKAIGNVSWTIYHLNSIRGLITKLQEDSNRNGMVSRDEHWEEYQGTILQAKKELGHLLELL